MERNELVEKILKLMGEDALEEEQIKEIKEELFGKIRRGIDNSRDFL